jgi:serine/threonine-protein kinase
VIPAARWERVKELFDGAAGLDPDARAAFLAEACGDDGALREEVESLLLAHDQAGGFLPEPPPDPDAGDAAEDLADRRLGPYRLLHLIGQGGMGHVYRAIRDDDQFKKLVAVKLVRVEMATDAVLARFRAERQILAGLEHPGIARLLDGGAIEDGRPFLVMEHVEGTRIDVYARDHALTTAARVTLFRSVCAAVQYAHENLVVHRDLKPANILVTPDGLPKLLDFGVAKLMDPSGPGAATATLFAAMTPAYASPEQVRSEPITTATDVYSLGVVLHELLTGRRPYRLAGVTSLELQQAICEQEPERPALPDDLGAIVLKALRKAPHLRYPTVAAFSEDLGRYLAGLPVSARKGTARYRAARFVRRHRVKVALSALLAVAAASFAANTAVQAGRVAREKDKTERVTGLLVGLFRVSDPGEARGNTVTAREMLDRGAARVRAELAAEPEVQAALLDTMGRVYGNLGLYAEAQPLVEEALATRRRVLGDDHDDVAASLKSLATLAVVLQARGRCDEAERLAREVVAVPSRLGPRSHPDAARAERVLGACLAAGRYDRHRPGERPDVQEGR